MARNFVGPIRPLEDPELMAEDEDLEILSAVVFAASAEETGEDPDHEVQEEQHRRIVRCCLIVNRGFRPPRARLAQGREERAGPELGDAQLDVAGLGAEEPPRLPLRWVVRPSVRSYRLAPIAWWASSSMSC